MRDHDAADLGQPLARSGEQFKTASLKQNVGHVGDQAACGVAGGKDGI